METDKLDKTLSAVMGMAFVLVMFTFVAGMVPQPQFTCPICGEKFFTYDELYQHFITEHPAEPIEVIWE